MGAVALGGAAALTTDPEVVIDATDPEALDGLLDYYPPAGCAPDERDC